MRGSGSSDRIERVEHDGLTLPVLDSGPIDGDIVVLVHGWPQDASSWDRVVPLLHEQGLRTVVPTLRGATSQAAPRSRWAYRKTHMRADLVALLETIGQPVHLVGHDWGAALAWSIACRRPELLASLTAVSVPHVGAFLRAMPRSRQALASWYIAAFQLPLLPELMLSDPRRAARLLRSAGQERELAARDARRMTDRRVLRGGLGWYRSLLGDHGEATGTTAVPTLQVWSDRDTAITRAAVDGAHRHATGRYELLVLPGVSHWVPEAAPDQLAAAIVRHVG